MQKTITFYLEEREFNIHVKKLGFWGRIFGFMLKRRKKAEALLFDYNRNPNGVETGIHSIFVFFPFIIVWLDEQNKIIGARKVKPFTLAVFPPKKHFRFLEIPENGKYDRIINEVSQFNEFKKQKK